MRKKWLALATLLVFCLTLFPQVGAAAEGKVQLQVYGFNKESEEVWIFAKGIEIGDAYALYLNRNYSNPLVFATFNQNGEEVLRFKKTDYPALSDLRKGDVLNVRVTSAGLGKALADIDEKYNANQVVPDEMELLTSSIARNEKNQRITIHFDKEYEPTANDAVRVVPFDKAGKRLGRDLSQVFAVKKEALLKRNNKQEFSFYLTPANDVAYYEVQFLNGNTIAASLTKKLNLTLGFDEIDALMVTYPKKEVTIGETMKPELYLKDKDGKRHPLVDETVWSFNGDAIASSDPKDGSFTVKNDPKYAGSKVIITTVSGKFSRTNTIVVKDKTPPPAEVEKTTVIMGINSYDVLINGKKHKIDAVPVIDKNRTFVPLRAMAEAFGAKVDYDYDSQQITISDEKKKVVMTIGKTAYRVNNKVQQMDVAPYVVAKAKRTMVPVRFAAEALDYQVDAVYATDGTTSKVVFNN